MSLNKQYDEVAVDRRDETIVTQQPGYAATEQVLHDVAAERRMGDVPSNQDHLKHSGFAGNTTGLALLLEVDCSQSRQ